MARLRVQSPHSAHTKQGGPHGDSRRHRTHGGADGDGAAKHFSDLDISTTQAINMFLKQAVREQGIPFEVSARPTVECGSENIGK